MRPIYSDQPSSAIGYVIDDAVDAASCARWIALATADGFAPSAVDYPPSYRDNDRVVRDDPALAAALFQRLRASLPARVFDAQGSEHVLVGLNERFRFCRYRDGQSFRIHRDGAHARSDDERSRLTLQIYLDDGFEGGHTRFYASRTGPCLGSVRPVRGAAIVFDHDLWHDGEPVVRGEKHVLRTDVLYRRVGAPGIEAEPSTLGRHQGYVFAAIVLEDGRVASASRDRTIMVSGRSFPSGHDASVHALVESTPGVILSGSRDRTVRALCLHDGSSRVVGHHAGAVLSLVRIADGVASGGADAAVVLRDLDGRARATLRGHDGWVWSVAGLGPDLLVSGSEDGSIRLWNVALPACVDAAHVGRGPVHALARLDDHHFVAGHADGHVLTWEVDRRRGMLACVDVLSALPGEIYSLCPLGDGLLAVGGEDERVRVFRGASSVAELAHGGFVRALAALPDGRLVSGSYDGTVREWNVRR